MNSIEGGGGIVLVMVHAMMTVQWIVLLTNTTCACKFYCANSFNAKYNGTSYVHFCNVSRP